MFRSFRVPFLSTLLLIMIWGGLAFLSQSRYLPSPIDVAKAFIVELSSGALLFHLSATFLRVMAAFIIALVFGTAIGLMLGRSNKANQFFDPWLIFALNRVLLSLVRIDRNRRHHSRCAQ